MEKDIFSGTLKIITLIPAYFIGLKFQALYNNPLWEKTDMADIELLISVNRNNLDWELIRKYCEIFSMEDLYRQLRRYRVMNISPKAEKELIELARSEEFSKDMDLIGTRWHNPFLMNGSVDVAAYIEFVHQFNEFINHEPTSFRPIIDKDMRL